MSNKTKKSISTKRDKSENNKRSDAESDASEKTTGSLAQEITRAPSVCGVVDLVELSKKQTLLSSIFERDIADLFKSMDVYGNDDNRITYSIYSL